MSANVDQSRLPPSKNLHLAEPSGMGPACKGGITTLLLYSVSGSGNVSRLIMERRTHSDENGQASEAELAGLRGGLAQEVIASGEAVDKMIAHPYYQCMCQRFMSTGSSDLAKPSLTMA